MLSANELLDLQADMEAIALNLTADIKRNTSATISIGQPTENITTIASGVACGMTEPSKAQAQLYASLIGVQQATVISFKTSQTLQRNDLVLVLGQTWTVQALFPQSYPVLTQVLATRIQ